MEAALVLPTSATSTTALSSGICSRSATADHDPAFAWCGIQHVDVGRRVSVLLEGFAAGGSHLRHGSLEHLATVRHMDPVTAVGDRRRGGRLARARRRA